MRKRCEYVNMYGFTSKYVSDLRRVAAADPAGVRAAPAPPQEGPQLRGQGEATMSYQHELSQLHDMHS